MLRIQAERLAGLALDLEEYKARYQANAERIAAHAPKALIMHPGPMIRGLEITSEVADGPQSAIADQVRNGVAIRMALIMRALSSEVTSVAQKQEREPADEADPDSRRTSDRSGVRHRCATRSAARRWEGCIGRCAGENQAVHGAEIIDGERSCRGTGTRRYSRSSSRTRPGIQGDDCDRHGSSSGRRIHNCLRHAQYNSGERLARKLPDGCSAPERGAAIRVFPIAAATRGSMGEALTEYGSLKAAGAVAVTDDGKPILGDAIMREALIAAARANLPVIQHAEDTRLTGGCSMNAGRGGLSAWDFAECPPRRNQDWSSAIFVCWLR